MRVGVMDAQARVGESVFEIAYGPVKSPQQRAGLEGLPGVIEIVPGNSGHERQHAPDFVRRHQSRFAVAGRHDQRRAHALVPKMPGDHVDVVVDGGGEHGIDPLQHETFPGRCVDPPAPVDQPGLEPRQFPAGEPKGFKHSGANRHGAGSPCRQAFRKESASVSPRVNCVFCRFRRRSNCRSHS